MQFYSNKQHRKLERVGRERERERELQKIKPEFEVANTQGEKGFALRGQIAVGETQKSKKGRRRRAPFEEGGGW
ncbi:hypothetical protein C1H46_011461 [Malus baccata]|uniref:Uncharacterized protein n=1 Tax=Malus baccata TaxID=106549 RepID=A0A540MXB2_MALBA|nr:hypothetical protein C1H46_011461 [Malus baccata]